MRRANARAWAGRRTTRTLNSSSGVCFGLLAALLEVGFAVGLQEHGLALGVPPERDRVHPELFLDGSLQRVVVGLQRAGRRVTARRGVLVQERVDPLGENRQLFLLAGHADQARRVPCLQEKGALAGRSDGASDEPLGALELEDRHTATLTDGSRRTAVCALGTAVSDRVVRARTAAHDGVGGRLRCRGDAAQVAADVVGAQHEGASVCVTHD